MKRRLALAPPAAVIVLVVLAMALSGGCSVVSTEPDQVALAYEDGPLESKKFGGCYASSKREFDGPYDKHFLYPTNQRFVDATGGEQSDFPAIRVVSRDNVELAVPITINFFLNTECQQLRRFHESVGSRFRAYMDDDELSPGWTRMLDVIIRQPLDTTLDRIAQNYPWRSLYNDPEVKVAIEKAVNENIEAIVRRQTNNNDFFNNWSALIQKPTPTNDDLVRAIAAEQTNVANAQAAEAKAKADRAAAEAQVAVQRAEAAKIAERVRVIGIQGYLQELAIEKGINPFQPSYGAAVVNPGQ